MRIERRSFLGAAGSGAALLGLGDLSFLPAAGAGAGPAPIRSGAALAKLIEETPRDRLLEEIGARIRKGLGYREALAGLLLAAVRNVQPRPSVGFKFHAVLVINSAHLASLSSPDADRWLPIFWALDHFKSAQADEKKTSGWTMGAVDEPAVPPAHKARAAFVEAMEKWDDATGDAAAAGLARGGAAHEIFELLARYAARDFRSIGHKAIFVANGWRVLESVGWEHAEPVLRSLARALLAHEGQNPLGGDAPADRPWKFNRERAAKIRADWRAGKIDDAATRELLSALREASDDGASAQVVEILNRGVAPQSIWDSLFAAAGELLMRAPGIPSLHAVTTLNAVRHLFATSGDDETRRLLLLQAASFLPMFRETAARRGKLAEVKIDGLEQAAPGEKPVEEIFADVSRDKLSAARKALGYLKDGDAKALIDAARVLIFLKGMDSHDYKFSSAVLEDHGHLSPAWRDRFLASSVYWLKGSGAPDNKLVGRIRAALRP
jgi:hypothetical protein